MISEPQPVMCSLHLDAAEFIEEALIENNVNLVFMSRTLMCNPNPVL